MKKCVSAIAAIGLMFVSSFSIAGEVYESEEGKFKITMPGEFEAETEVDDDGVTTISLTCDYGGMTIVVNSYIYLEEVSEDDNLVAELTEIIRVAGALGSKFKAKGLALWSVGDDSGWMNALKTKGDFKGYIGNHYVIVNGFHYYSIIVLGQKKAYDSGIESRLVNSFEVIE